MSDADDDHCQPVARFRYGVIADLVHVPSGSPGVTEKLRAKAARDYAIPGSRRTRIASAKA